MCEGVGEGGVCQMLSHGIMGYVGTSALRCSILTFPFEICVLCMYYILYCSV